MIDTAKKRKVHSRGLQIVTYEDGPQGVIIEGRLKDECYVHRYLFTGSERPPGTIHDMIVRMAVRGPELKISEIEVEMPSVPRSECLSTASCLDPLVGMSISSGFTLKVKEKIGGPKGCAHLGSLVLSMASAAVQGAWSAWTQKPLDPAVYGDTAMNFLADTCIVWKKGGRLEREYREKINNLKES